MRLNVEFDWRHGSLARLEEAPALIKRAMQYAISNVTQWARVQVLRGVSAATSIQIRVIQGRMHVTIRDGFGWVWVGLNPVSARRLNPKEVDGGVQAAGRFFPGAFIVKGTGPLAGQVMVRKGKERLPIQKETVDIQAEAEPVVQRIASQVNERLYREFARQVGSLTA